ncbi:DJ-1/PfpI family protein [Mesobacillus subterraneus]|uniref:DJ-1/PfpI family protein n=1 Tax=Mesobacillus subterraneus TaxID=285983 RepID=UPI001FE8B785|nr:DJ-1/PfpI family protein [Mesobacillus subterraneus]
MQGQKPVLTVAIDHSPIKGESGLTCLADQTVSETDFEEIDSLILPGCMDIMALADMNHYVQFIKELAEKGSVIASISSSPLLLAKAGLLKGKKFTVGLTDEAIKESGVFELNNLSNDLVVRDGNIITARGSGFIRFGSCIGDALKLDFDERWYKENHL